MVGPDKLRLALPKIFASGLRYFIISVVGFAIHQGFHLPLLLASSPYLLFGSAIIGSYISSIVSHWKWATNLIDHVAVAIPALPSSTVDEILDKVENAK